jgi:hypothetical protein
MLLDRKGVILLSFVVALVTSVAVVIESCCAVLKESS